MKSKHLLCLAILLLAGVIYAAFIQRTQEPLLMYREQQQIFLWDADYISGLLGQTGGFSTLVSQFLVQFFHLPWAGAIITALLTTITGMFLRHSIYRLNKNITWWPLPFLAAYLHGIYLLDMGYHYDGVVAMLMLDKNMEGIRILADRYLPYQNGDDVPLLMQQAVTVYAEHDEEYCRNHGVSDETINRFMSFKQAVLNARRNNMNQQTALASYRGTFWYYYMFE